MYKLKLSPEKFKNLGFKYDPYTENYSYEFPVYKYKTQPTLVCRLWVDAETCELSYVVQDVNRKIYAAFYNRECGGTNWVVLTVEENIAKEFKRLGVKKIK